jgi:hypothetical protein
MRYIKPSTVRQLAKANGKRVAKSFMLWLDGKVERIVTNECKQLGTCKKTLNLEDSAAMEAYKGRH